MPVRALQVRLTGDELRAIDTVFPVGAATGTRYPENQMNRVRR